MSNHDYSAPQYRGNAFGVHKVEQPVVKVSTDSRNGERRMSDKEIVGKIGGHGGHIGGFAIGGLVTSEIDRSIKLTDTINPSHYRQGDVECIDAIKSSLGDEGYKAYLKGSVMKYLWRYERKNGIEDLEKANWFLDRLREEVKRDNDK